jgi:hypothetical protein
MKESPLLGSSIESSWLKLPLPKTICGTVLKLRNMLTSFPAPLPEIQDMSLFGFASGGSLFCKKAPQKTLSLRE